MSSATLESPVRFQDLSLQPSVLRAVELAGYQTPTPIQAAFIPEAVAGRDVIGQAQTGTGKTAAFLLPILQGLQREAEVPQALILVPTRELVNQIALEAKKLSHGQKVRVAAIYGGSQFRAQFNALRDGCELVVGTPGRILDHLGRGTLKLHSLRFVVLDEADRMLDIGFRPDIERILRRCPADRQTLLLSATLSLGVQRLAQRYMRRPVSIDLSPKKLSVDTIRQTFITVDERRKLELLQLVIHREKPRQCIIFCQTKRGADELYRELREDHQKVATMHGDLQQKQRERIMEGFRNGKVTILVATDVVGRGIDVNGISHIINYDLPDDSENYIHRIGRTGRMGADGIAIAFVTPDEGKKLTAIENLMNHVVEEDRIEGFEAFQAKALPAAAAAKAPSPPAFGRRVRRYRRGL